MLGGKNLEERLNWTHFFKKEDKDGPLPLDTLWALFDLSDQQADWPVDVVGLDVANNRVEEGTNLLVVRRSQHPLLLHWKTTQAPSERLLSCPF